jgi:hypothetical protein
MKYKEKLSNKSNGTIKVFSSLSLPRLRFGERCF